MELSEKFDEKLPVDEARDDFDEAVADGRPLVVVAPTGSGKSTRLPLWLADDRDGTVLVVEPRRVACRSLANYLSDVIGESVGDTIGYRVRFDDTTSSKTRIVFATTGIAIRMLAGDGTDGFSAVILDEFHERGWEVDLITAVMLDAIERDDYGGDLILTSATVDAADVAQQISAQVVEARGRSYPVDISYRDRPPAPTSDKLASRVCSAVEDVVTGADDDGGDILVFLPGKGEISDCKSALRPAADRHDLDLMSVHGRLPPRRLSRAFSAHDGNRRVFLSTNVAETSLTLPGVTTVIDSGLVRMRIHRGGRTALALVPIAEDSMDQRAGRAGRVRPGRCIRLWSRRFQPDSETRPEIERTELDDVLLRAARCGLDGERFDEATWITEPPEFAVQKARTRLRRMGAIDGDHCLTERGRRMGELPVDGDEARILLDPPDDLAGTCADLVALLQMGRDLLLDRRYVDGPFERVKQARTEMLQGIDDEVYVQLHCLRFGDPKRHGLHRGRLREARRIARSLRKRAGANPIDPTDDRDFAHRDDLADYLLQRIPESAFVVRSRALKRRRDGKAKRGRSEPWGNGDIELAIWPFEPPVIDHTSDDERDDPVAGLVLDHFWLGNDGIGVRGTGRMVLPCTYNQLLGANIGDVEIDEVRAGHRHGTPYVRAAVERSHAGVVLDRDEEPLRGEQLWPAAAQAIIDGNILHPAGEKVLDDLHIWDIMARWPDRDLDKNWESDSPPPPPQDYIADRLQKLGVESDTDLMLVEPEDLRPDLVDELQTYRFEVESMAEDFPRIWSHQGCRYRCDVSPTAQKVVLTPLDKTTRRSGEPDARYVPRFRGFKVIYRNDSRVVPVRS